MGVAMQGAIRTLIVDDEPLARRGLELRLAGEPDVEIVRQCGNGAEAVKAVAELQPDLMFLDVQMPGLDGFAALRAIPASQLPLVVFVTAPGRILSRATLLDRLGGANAQATDRSIDTLVARIRKKLEDADGGIELIKTVRGLGYCLDVPVRRR